jgi:O-antigen/teichoic acid export membrane protein
MSREARRGIVRIFCNYARLFSTLLLGLALVPLTIAWLGDDAYGLTALLGANIGLANVFRQIMQQSLVRELAAAYHAGDGAMARIYPAVCRISLIAAVMTFGAFVLMAFLLPVFNMPDRFREAAFWFLIAQGAQSSCMVFLSPVLNMYQVAERFVGYSIWFVAVRATGIASVVFFGFMVRVEDAAAGLVLYGALSSGLAVVVYIIASARMVALDRRLMPTLRKPQPGAVREVMGTFSWNSGVQIAMNAHEQVPPFMLNLFFGTTANAAWGLGFKLVAYIRMVTTGMQFGSDAVSARMAAHADPETARRNLQNLTAIQTRLTGLISLPAAAGVLLYCYPALHLWVGHTLEDYDHVMGMGVLIARVLAVAIAARAISDTWILVLYGAGHIRSYAPLVIAGGLVAPLISVALLTTLPDRWAFTGPALAFTTVFLTAHLIGVPLVAARRLHLSPWVLMASVLRPLAVTLLASAVGLGVLAAGHRLGDLSLLSAPTEELGRSIDPRWMLGSIAAFGVAYAPLSYMFVLGPGERKRIGSIIGAVARRIPGVRRLAA